MFFLDKFLSRLQLPGLVLALLAGCGTAGPSDNQQTYTNDTNVVNELSLHSSDTLHQSKVHPLEKKMIEAGMIDVLTVDSSLVIEIKYATEDNFLGRDIYQGMKKAYLQPQVAEMLARAHAFLKQRDSTLRFIIYDAARPRQAQQELWDATDAPFEEKIRFLSNPANGSVHNFGAAVDLSIVDKNDNPLDMGTSFDFMGELAYPSLEKEMFDSGKLSQQQIDNRKLLREVMIKAGFSGIKTEWWHFNAMTRKQARQQFQIIE